MIKRKIKKYYLYVKENIKMIPEINSLEHGNRFCNDNYDGYDFNFFIIEYFYKIIKQFFLNRFLMGDVFVF